VGILCLAEDRQRLPAGEAAVRIVELGSTADPGSVAPRLYAALREMDAAGVDVILARGFPSTEGLGVAIQDRLRRAAAGRIVHVTSAPDDRVSGPDGQAPSSGRSGRAG
jgi:L-threonylcarbamoyladenylate synthase